MAGQAIKKAQPETMLDIYGRGGGGKAGGGGSASTAPDTLFSTSTVNLIGLIGEGETGGVVGGLKGVYRNNTPIQNQDGSFNFKGITADFREGSPDQPYMAGFPGVQTEQPIGVVVRQSTPVVGTITDPSFDRVRVTIAVGSLFMQKTDGSMRANIVNYRIEIQYYNGPWMSQGDFNINGKTSSGYYRQHEFPLPKNPSGEAAPWNIRVTRLTPDDDQASQVQEKFTVQSTMTFYSITGLIDTKFSYPHSALIGISATTSQLGDNVGEIRVLTDGIKMMVPSNRTVNEVTRERTYTGIWDGTFKEEVSDSPIWLLNHLVTNDRFGLGQYVDEAGIDRITFYEIGRYCDQLVSDGAGGFEPRYTFNGEINNQQEAYDLLQLIAQVYRGMVYWSSGAITSTQDRPGDIRMLVTESNVIDGKLEYSSSSRKARHTVAMVKWHDPKNLYRENIEFVENSEGIALYGYNPVEIDLLGCTSRGQAHRAGLWTLYTELYETQVLSYRAGLDHALLRPGELIAVQDPQVSNLDLSGRLRGGSTTTLYLDHNISLTTGVTYTVSVVLPDGTVQEKSIQSATVGSDGRTVLTLSSALTMTPVKEAVWQIAGNIVPQKFRVVSIKEEEPHIYSIVALEHEPSKFAAIDDGAAFEETDFSDFPNIVAAPTNLQVRSALYMENLVPRQSITLSWLPGNAFNSIGYYVTIIMPSGDIVNRPRTASTSIDILDAEAGPYRFVVVAAGLDGKTSLPSEIDYTLGGWSSETAATVKNLQVLGGGSTFSGRSATLTWENEFADGRQIFPLRNVVRVYDADTSNMIHVEVLALGQVLWTYDYNVNVNEGGPRRRFRVAVSALSPDGAEGFQTSLVVQNPPPGVIIPTATSNSETLFIDLPGVADNDHVGYLVWVSVVPGFNPLTTGYVDTIDRFYNVRAQSGQTYYIRAAAYDAFSKDPGSLAISAEISEKIQLQIFDELPPDIPGAPTLTSTTTDIAPDGTVTSRIAFSWPPSGPTNLGTYEVAIAEGNNPAESAYRYDRRVSDPTTVFTGLIPGRQYSFKVRATPANGFDTSGWSTVLVVTAALNVNAPANPTGMEVRAAFERAVITFTPPADKDLAYIEVAAAGGSFTADQPISGYEIIGRVPSNQTSYWDTLPTEGVRTYWLRSVNTSGVPASSFVRAGTATTVALLASQLQAEIIDATKFAKSIAANTVVEALPTSRVTDYVTFQGQQYRWDSAAGVYTKAVPAADIAGKIIAAQIETVNKEAIAAALAASAIQTSQLSGNLDAARIAGQVKADQIENRAITAAKFAEGLSPIQDVNALPDPATWTGSSFLRLASDGKLYRLVSGAWTKNIDIGDTVGTVPEGRLPAFNASNLYGTLDQARISSIAASKIEAGLTAAQIASVNAATVSGQLTQATIPTSQLLGSITKTQISDYSISTLKLEAGAVTASKLDIVSRNFAYNPDYMMGQRGWTLDYQSMSAVVQVGVREDYCPAGTKTLMFNVPGNLPAGSLVQVRQGPYNTSGNEYIYPAAAGSTYELSACVGSHRCSGYILVVFYNAADALVSQFESTRVTDNYRAGGAYADWEKAKLIVKAPAGTTAMRIYFRLEMSYASNDPYLFISNFMMASTREGATETSPYVSPGLTAIGGGTIITNSLDASKIIADTITAREIKADAIETKHIKAGAIETVHMDAGTINASVLVGLSIQAGQIAAGQITTSKLAIRSSNMAYNPDFANGLSGWNQYYGSYPGTEIAEFGINTQWCPSGFKAVKIRTTRTGAQPGTQFGVNVGIVGPENNFSHHRVTGGITYEFSAFMSNHRCTGWLYVDFQDNTGAYLETHIGVLPHGSGGGEGGSPDTYPRIKLIAKAPNTAVTAVIYFMGRDPVGPEPPYIFVSGFMMAACPAGTTETSPYVAPGVTAIDGSGIITNTLQAAKIVSGSITTRELNVGSIFADSAVISNISTRVLVANAIKTDMIEAKAIGGDKLRIASSNYAYNADFAQDGRGWFVRNGGGGNHGGPVVEPVDPYWAPAGMRAYVTRTAAAPTLAGGYYDINAMVCRPDNTLEDYFVAAGTRFEISAYLSAHRCDGYLVIGFIDGAGVYFSQTVGTRVRDNGYSNLMSLEDWNTYARSKAIVTVPAGAVKMNVAFRAADFNPNSQGSNAYLMVSGLMIAPLVQPNQTTFSPYIAPSMTTIDGGKLITDTIVARHIASDAIQTRHMTANTIDAKVLVGESIVAGKLATNAVEAKNITAESITAGKLLLSDTTNMLRNGYFLNGSSEGWLMAGDGVIDYANPSLDPSGPYRITSTTRHPAYSHWIDVTPGDWLYFSCDVYNGHPSGDGGMYIEYYTKAMTNGIGRFVGTTGVKNAWTRLETRDQVPAGVQQVRLLPYADATGGRCWWTKFQIRRASNASLIVDGAITARTINAGEVFSTRGIFDNLVAGIATFGGLKADQIAAGAITTSKLAINGANMAFNPDFSQGSRGWGRWDGWGSTDASRLSAPTIDRNWNPSGFKSLYVTYDKPLAQIDIGQAFGLYCGTQDASGNQISYPLNPETTYEVSAFVSLHRCRGRIYIDTRGPNGEYTGNFQAVDTGGGGIGGDQRSYPRMKLIFKTPPNTASMDLYFMAHTISGDVPYIFVSGLMIAATTHGATETSPYVTPSATLIEGGNIFTNSLNADRITAGTITTDRLQAGNINVDTIAATGSISADKLSVNTLTAGNIKITGDYRLSNWASGTSINGGAIAANSIEAQRLRISTRGITPVNVNFYMDRDANGNATGWLNWTGGQIEYIDDNGNRSFAQIPAGARQRGGDGWVTVWWNKIIPGSLQSNSGNNTADIFADPNCILVATSADITGVTVNWGGTIIDGDKIVTNSIQSRNIATNAIQARNIATNAITADKVLAGQITADKINIGVGGKNLLTNSDYLGGAIGSIPTGYGLGINADNPAGVLEWFGINNLDAYQPSGVRSLRLSYSNAPQATRIADIYVGHPTNGGSGDRVPVIGGQRYEASVYVSAHRCAGSIVVTFYDDNNNVISGFGATPVPSNGAAYGLQNWGRSTLMLDAPANASRAAITLRMHFDGSNNPYTFWACPYFGQATPNQTVFSAWGTGGATTIDGGYIRTSSIAADRLSVTSLSAVSADLGTVTAGRMQSPDGKVVFDLSSRRLLISD